MPVLYCRPINNLANRMMSITSAYRLSKMWGFDFCLIWDWGSENLFASPYEDLFKINFEVIRDFSNKSHNLFIPPRSESGRHFYKKPINGQDVLLDGWGHLTLCESDLTLTPVEITSQLRLYFNLIFVPSEKVMNCCENLGYFNQYFNLGIHIRRGSIEFNNSPSNDKLLSIISNIISTQNPESIFISSNDFQFADQLGLSYYSERRIFVSRCYNNQPSFRNHALAIYDLIFLSRCTEIIKNGATTFSSLAGLIGESEIYTINNEGQYSKHPAIYSAGAGL